MEHRNSSRTQLRRLVGVEYRRQSPPLTAYVHDMSLGGMFIETDSPVLRERTSVMVSFVLPRNGTQDRFVLEAEVVRRGPDGVGLMFKKMDPGAILTLSRALLAQQAP